MRWSIRGLSGLDDLYFYKQLRAERDLLLMQLVVAVACSDENRALAYACVELAILYDPMLPKRWQLDIAKWERDAECMLALPLELLEAALEASERHVASLFRMPLSPETAKAAYRLTNRVMKPLIRPMGYQTLKQLEAACAVAGDKMPWPRKGR
jgi:hypothetical protein